MGLTLFHAEQCQLRSRSWVDSSHGSQFLRVLWPKPAMTAFPSVHLQVWDCHYWKGQKCRITPGPLPKGTFFNVMLISLKKRRRRQEPLHLMWCYICHFLFHWKNSVKIRCLHRVHLLSWEPFFFSGLKLWVWSKNDSVSASSHPC